MLMVEVEKKLRDREREKKIEFVLKNKNEKTPCRGKNLEKDVKEKKNKRLFH